jgi:hypothetical protein
MKLPILRGTYCQGFAACGKILTDALEVLDEIDRLSKNANVAEYAQDKTPMIMRSIWGGATGSHVHIDIIKKQSFSTKIAWKINAEHTAMLASMDFLIGKQVESNVFARFSVPAVRLSRHGVVAATFFEVNNGEFAIRLTAGEISFEDTPLQKIRWAISKDRLNYLIELTMVLNLEITEEYLHEIFEVVNSIFLTLVMTRRP